MKQSVRLLPAWGAQNKTHRYLSKNREDGEPWVGKVVGSVAAKKREREGGEGERHCLLHANGTDMRCRPTATTTIPQSLSQHTGLYPRARNL